MPRLLLLALLALLLPVVPALAEDAPAGEAPAPADEAPALAVEDPENPLALVKTSMGDFIVELFAKETPETVANFLGLAEGTKEFKDPVSGEQVKRPYYDGLTFHRVLKNFVVQGGCSLGTGSGGPGYRFANEINGKALGLDKQKAVDFSNPQGPRPNPLTGIRSQQDFHQFILTPTFKELGITTPDQAQAREPEIKAAVAKMTVLDVLKNKGYAFLDEGNSHGMKRGTLAMANAGPNTNGSQFYVNLKDNEYLNGKHTVFGRVVQGMDVVDKMSNVAVGQGGKPREALKIISIRRYTPDAN